jgi:hypothetical protein
MRVIRTEEYFDPSKVRWDYQELMHGNPGIGFAFINLPRPGPTQLDEFDRFTVHTSPLADPATAEIEIDQFLNAAIQSGDLTAMEELFRWSRPRRARVGGRTERSAVSELSRLPPQPLVRDIRNLDIVIETSPPQLINFDTLLKLAGPAVAVGTFIGVSAVSYPILLLTVPAGIVGAGAAIAISKIMEDGFPKVVERWISNSAPQRRPPVRSARRSQRFLAR